MSIKLYLNIRANQSPVNAAAKNASFEGDYLVTLRADTPEDSLASAAYDAVLQYFNIENAADFNVNTRDQEGHIVLDTTLPAYGSLSQYGLNAVRIETPTARAS